MNAIPLVRRFSLVLAITGFACAAGADQVVMENGDRYHGRVLSVTATNVVLHSEVLGTINLARGKVATMAFGATATTNAVPPAAPARTNSPTELSAAVRQLGAQSNLVQQVRAEFLTAANPETHAKFNQMLNDLTTGKMSVADLRAEAKSAAAQLRALEREAGEDADGTINLYLSILDNFVRETGPATGEAGRPAGAALK